MRQREASAGIQRPGVVVALRAMCDAIALVGAFVLTAPLREALVASGIIPPPPQTAGVLTLDYAVLAAGFTAIALVVFWHRGLYRPRASVLNLWELETALRALGLSTAFFFALLFLFKVGGYSRVNVASAIAAGAVLVLLERRALASLFGRLHRRRRAGRRVVIYGCGTTGRLLMKKIVQAPHMGSTVVGFLDDTVLPGTMVSCRVAQTGPALFEAPVLGRWGALDELASQGLVDELLVVPSSINGERLPEVVDFCRSAGIRLGVVPQLESLRLDQFQIEDLSAIPVLRPSVPSTRLPYRIAKRAFDAAVASALLIGTAPVWLAIAILIRLDSRGPVLFVQERIGLKGRVFRMYKFRSMRTDTDPYAASPVGDLDARITRVGRLLRMTGLDELPQLLNVLRGEMSLVGPRPEMPFIVNRYTAVQRQRLLAKPGITGLWQLSSDRHAEIHENIEYDLFYIGNQSLMLDALILLETLFFTAGVALKSLRRDEAVHRPALVPTGGELDGQYVLLALDQRCGGETPPRWRTYVPALYQLADRWPVRILVAPGNVEAHDALIASRVRQRGSRQPSVRFTYYRTRAELRTLVRGASLVVTDLAHVMAWTQEAGTPLLGVFEDEARWRLPSSDAPAMAVALDELLSERQPPAADRAIPVARQAVAADRVPPHHPGMLSRAAAHSRPEEISP